MDSSYLDPNTALRSVEAVTFPGLNHPATYVLSLHSPESTTDSLRVEFRSDLDLSSERSDSPNLVRSSFPTFSSPLTHAQRQTRNHSTSSRLPVICKNEDRATTPSTNQSSPSSPSSFPNALSVNQPRRLINPINSISRETRSGPHLNRICRNADSGKVSFRRTSPRLVRGSSGRASTLIRSERGRTARCYRGGRRLRN